MVSSCLAFHLRRSREAEQLSQTALARTVGCQPSMISQIEHGSKQPSVPLLLRLATALHLPSLDLLLHPGCAGCPRQGAREERPLC